jgi:hypothetical protein
MSIRTQSLAHAYPWELADNIRMLGECMDLMRDTVLLRFEVAIPGRLLRGSRFGSSAMALAQFIDNGMREAVELGTRERRYDMRPRPRLGAGTRGYRPWRRT